MITWPRRRRAVDRGDFELFVHTSRSLGAMLLGRFCHGDARVRAAGGAPSRAEEALRPEVLFAEIVHYRGPPGKSCAAGAARHEIRSSACRRPTGATDSPGRSAVRVRAAKCVPLRAARREVVPRLTSAHNYLAASLAIYRFLACSRRRARAALDLGPLEDASFLPRVTRGRCLFLARWTFYGRNRATRRRAGFSDLAGDPAGVRGGARQRAAHRSERDGVGQLPRWRRTAAGGCKSSIRAGSLVPPGGSGSYAHEMVIPLTRTRGRQKTNERGGGGLRRSFPPGSRGLREDLRGPTTADRVLRRIVGPWCASCANRR